MNELKELNWWEYLVGRLDEWTYRVDLVRVVVLVT